MRRWIAPRSLRISLSGASSVAHATPDAARVPRARSTFCPAVRGATRSPAGAGRRIYPALACKRQRPRSGALSPSTTPSRQLESAYSIPGRVVEVEHPTESLDDGDRTAVRTGSDHSGRLRRRSEVRQPEQRRATRPPSAPDHGPNGSAARRARRGPIALSYGSSRQHSAHEVGGGVGHVTSARDATGTPFPTPPAFLQDQGGLLGTPRGVERATS